MPIDDGGYWFAPTDVDPAELSRPHPPDYRYRNPIPPCTDQTPGQLLDTYYPGGDQPNPKNLLEVQLRVYLDFPDNIGAPVGSSGLIGRFPRPDGLQVVPVPLGIPGGEPVRSFTKVVVDFKSQDPVGPSKGVPLAELYSDTLPSMEDADEILLHKFRVLGPWKDIDLTIVWPGYKPERYPIRATTCGELLTRRDLGTQIALAYGVFFKKVETQRRLPSKPDFFNIALHQGENFRSDSLGVQLGQLHLVRFRNTMGGFWVADVEVV